MTWKPSSAVLIEEAPAEPAWKPASAVPVDTPELEDWHSRVDPRFAPPSRPGPSSPALGEMALWAQTWRDEPNVVDRAGRMGATSWDLNGEYAIALEDADNWQQHLYDLLDRQGRSTTEAVKSSHIRKAITDHVQRLEPGKPTSLIEHAKEWIRQRTGLFEPPIYGRELSRQEKPLRTVAGAGAYYSAEYLNGLGLFIPDIVTAKVSAYDSLSELVAASTGFRPTPRDVGAGEMMEFIGGLRTVGSVSKTLVSKIAARVALKQILSAGVTFAGRQLNDEIAQKIINGDPIEMENVWAQGGVGVCWGLAEVAVGAAVNKAGGWNKKGLADEMTRRMTGLRDLPRDHVESTAQAILDSYQVRSGWMTMDQWHGKWDAHLRLFSEELRAWMPRGLPGEVAAAKGEPATKVERPVPQLPPAIRKAQPTAAGLSWITELRSKLARGEALTAPERDFLESVGVDLMNPIGVETADEAAAITAEAVPPTAPVPGAPPAAVEPGAQAPAEAAPEAKQAWEMTREEWYRDRSYTGEAAKAWAVMQRYGMSVMEGEEPSKTSAFHGTTPDAAIAIARSGQIVPRRSQGDVLGETVVSMTKYEGAADDFGIVYFEIADEGFVDRSQAIFGNAAGQMVGLEVVSTEPIALDKIRRAVITLGSQETLEWKHPVTGTTLSDVKIALEHAGIKVEVKKAIGHEDMARQAVTEGKPVPRAVLEEYKSEPWAQEALAKLEKESAPPESTATTEIEHWGAFTLQERGGKWGFFSGENQIGKSWPTREEAMSQRDAVQNVSQRANQQAKLAEKNDNPSGVIPPDTAKRVSPATAARDELVYLSLNSDGTIHFERSGQIYHDKGSRYLIGGEDNIKAKSSIERERGRILTVTQKEYDQLLVEQSLASPTATTPEVSRPEETAGAGLATAEDAPIAPAKPPSAQTTPDAGREDQPPAEMARAAGKLDVSHVTDAVQGIVGIFEPTMPVIAKYGRGLNAEVLKAIHAPEAETLNFDEHRLEALDQTVLELEKTLNQYPKEIQEAVMLTRGHGLEGEARRLQVDAFAKLPNELKDSAIRRAIDNIADFNYGYLQGLLRFDEVERAKYEKDPVGWMPDYFYGIYKGGRKVSGFLKHWSTTDRYTKHKVFATYAEAKAYGLEARTVNPVANLRIQYQAIARRIAMKRLRNHLMERGEGVYIAKEDQAPAEWDFIGDPMRPEPTFADVRVEPTLAKLINSLISTNKITQNKVLDTWRKINNGLRTLKFTGSAFHAIQIMKQSVADTGYLSFYKSTSRTGFKSLFTDMRNDPALREAYQDYVLHGGGHRYSIDSQAQQAMNAIFHELTKTESMILKGLTLPIKIPVDFVNWMFEQFIPGVKFAKYLDAVGEMEQKLGRQSTSAEKIEIVKEQQNFYGMMNERLFGRSGTTTTALRFIFMAPGYAEGNYRTIAKAALQWGIGEDGYRASRSRSNIVNSWLVTGIAAAIGTMILTGKPPKKPETVEDIRDLLKIDTGKRDDHGDRIMIDLASYDKDYYNVAFNTLTGRPDRAVTESIKRIGGMKATTFEMLHDLQSLMMGKALYDWKEDVVYHSTDPFVQKMTKLFWHEIGRIEPISLSVLRQNEARGLDTSIAILESIIGLRPARDEQAIARYQALRDCWDFRARREELSWRLSQYSDPWGAVEHYNEQVRQLLNSKFVPQEMRDEWSKKLLIDPKSVVNWKRFPPSAMTNKQLRDALQEHTYKSAYRRADGKMYPRGHAKSGYEDAVEEIRKEMTKRGIR